MLKTIWDVGSTICLVAFVIMGIMAHLSPEKPNPYLAKHHGLAFALLVVAIIGFIRLMQIIIFH